MSYRIVILNGERRGERLDMETASLTLGQSPACDLRLVDPGIALLHAEILLAGEALSIRTCDESLRIHVNNIEKRETSLKHGDVVEIGSTRLFIQEYAGSTAWKTISGHRKWFTVGLPVLLVAALATLVHIRQNSTPKVAPPPIRQYPLHPITTGTNNWPDDNLVTNYPRILIDPSVDITSKPPELVEAKMLMEELKTNSMVQDITNAKIELDHGAQFLQQFKEQQELNQTSTNRSLTQDELKQAEKAFTNSTPPPDRTDP